MHLGDDELRMAGLGQDLTDHLGHLIGQRTGDRQVQVRGHGIADVGLDKSLQPRTGHRQPVIALQCRRVGRHRGQHVDSPCLQGVAHHVVVAHLGSGHPRHIDAAPQVRCHPGFIGEPVEGRHLAVGEEREQLVDTGMIGGNFRR